ncbi:MAG: ADP-ribosylation factor-like protein [Bacteroidaceae bacterium]|nr:ADP-ribosylation factor-like protein [Bacteroidaceae bacterium]
MKRKYLRPESFSIEIDGVNMICTSTVSKKDGKGGKYNPIKPPTVSVMILGDKGSGKTTLWNQLKKEHFDPNVYHNTGQVGVETKKIRSGLKTVRIEETKDFGGDDEWVPYYKEALKPNTRIYYLINLEDYNDYKWNEQIKRCKARLKAISVNTILENKEYYNQVSCRIIGTKLDKYETNDELKAAADIKHAIGMSTFKVEGISIKTEVYALNLIKNYSKIKNDIVAL